MQEAFLPGGFAVDKQVYVKGKGSHEGISCSFKMTKSSEKRDRRRRRKGRQARKEIARGEQKSSEMMKKGVLEEKVRQVVPQ